MANLTDDIARLTGLLVRDHQSGRKASALRQKARLDLSQVGKACGVAASTVGEWETGRAMPTTQQGLAWLTLLWDAQPPPPGSMPKRDSADLPKAPVHGKDGKPVKP